MANIKKIHVGSTDYDVEALHFNYDSTLDTPAQWKAYIDSIGELGFEIKIVEKSVISTATEAKYNTYKNCICLVAEDDPVSGSYAEYVIIRNGTEGSYTYSWEKIGSTHTDLSDYVVKGTYVSAEGGAGNTGNGGAATVTSSSAGAQTAVGTATVSYLKAATVTGENGGDGESANTGTAGAINYTPTFTGSAATITVESDAAVIDDHSFVPSGSVSISTTAASTTVIYETAGATADQPSFTGASITLNISGNVSGTAVGDHSYQPAGSISGAQAIEAHTHGASLTKSTITYASDVSSVSSEGGHEHTIDSHNHTENKTVVTGYANFSGGALNAAAAQTVVTGVTSASLTGDTSFFKDATVSDGVLSFNAGTVGITGGVASGTASVIPSYTLTQAALGDASTVSVAGAYAAATLTSSTVSGHTHTIALGTATLNVVTGVSVNAGGAATINFSNASFNGTTATLAHSVTQGSISITKTFTPSGTVSTPTITIVRETTGKTVATSGISGVSASFTGATATLTHSFTDATDPVSLSTSYTPAGTINALTVAAHSHSYTKPAAHVHSIALSTATVSGEVSVAVSDHTHSVSIANHTHSIGNHTHNIDLSVDPQA